MLGVTYPLSSSSYPSRQLRIPGFAGCWRRSLVAVALANRMARIIWALTMKKENYHAPELMGAVAGSGVRRRSVEQRSGGERRKIAGARRLECPSGCESWRPHLESAGRTANKVGANGQNDGIGKTRSDSRAFEPACRI